MKFKLAIAVIFLVGSSLKAQIRNIVYIDASSEIATFTRDEWQESLEETLKGLNRFETLVFLSNSKSASISTPENYIDIVSLLGTIRPSQPLPYEDIRLLVSALDKYMVDKSVNLYIYTSNEVFQSNVDLSRLLYDRIGLILNERADNIELNYYLHRSDTLRVVAPSSALNFKQTITYF